ncbi:MAG: redoxin domain-containing protein [Candidatus Omnitrophica bacterium]|nr:redoxin domain-containing protein [Candidatus Omnitrophota bacterium]
MEQMKRIGRMIRKLLAVAAWMCVIAGVVLPGRCLFADDESAEVRLLTVHLQGVYSSKISVTPFDGIKTDAAIDVVEDVKDGETAVLKIPVKYVPGEFLLRLDYRGKKTDHPYPSERNIFINKQNIELSIDPPYINNSEKTKFDAKETENTAYSTFMKENRARRAPVDFLKQLLLTYDRPKSKFYARAVKEFEERRVEYNAWVNAQSKKYQNLYVSRLFRFQHIPKMKWGGTPDEQHARLIQNYFEGIDFNDPLILRSRELSMLMNGYVRLFSMQAVTEKSRSELFAEAGRVACEKASRGNPKVYGWMVDYFYKGYETYGIPEGMRVLEKHINNPNCHAEKKQQIIKRLEGMKRLFPGAVSPDFAASDNEGNNFEFHKWKGATAHKLLLFWSSDCVSCRNLAKELKQWQNHPENKEKIDIAAVSLDETETETRAWEKEIANFPGWKHLSVEGGINGPVANDYAVLSTPVMFLVSSKDNTIAAEPRDVDELTKFLD